MSKFVDRPRYTCALGGALFTLRALERVIPIIHASAGCGFNLINATNAGAGYLGGGYCGGSAWSSTNVVEREVVFGGDDRLREQIRTTLEVIDGDLYIVVTGCMVDMIGDDVKAVTSEFMDEEVPVLAVPTPSFKGNSYTGYDMILSGLFRNYTSRSIPSQPGTVNILGLVPGQDVFYKGNLAEMKRLLTKLGLRVNTFFGEGETLENLKNAAEASLNLVLSDVYGIQPAREFEQIHGTPYLSLPFPIGALQAKEFLTTVANALHIDSGLAYRVIDEEEARYYDYLERVADIYNDIDLQRYAVVVGDANYAPAVSRFLADELGYLPKLAVVTDFLDDMQQKTVAGRFDEYESGIKPSVRFDTDASSVKRYIREIWEPGRNERYYDSFSPAVIVGSAFERELSAEFEMPLLTLSYPVTNRVVFNQVYAGYNGGLSLASDLLTALVAGR